MINRIYDTYEEAEKAAHSYLMGENPPPQEGIKVTFHATHSPDLKVMNTQPYTITMEGSESYAVILHNVSEFQGRTYEHANLIFVSSSERFTYPFRFLEREQIPFVLLCSRNRTFSLLKPMQDITADEAITLKGEQRIRNFFGIGNEYEDQQKTIEKARAGEGYFQEWEDEDEEGGIYYEAPDIHATTLAEATGKKIRNAAEYVAATEALIGREANAEEKKTLRCNFFFYQGEAFRLFCLYRFLYTEKYATIQEAAQEYAKFGLPANWAKRSDCTADMERGETLEEWVLSNYYDNDTFRYFTPITLKDVAEYTETPIKVLRQCSGESRDKKVLLGRMNALR